MAASRRLLLALWEHPHGLETTAEATHRLDNAADPNCLARRILAQCIYDIGKNTAHFGSAKIDGPALMWTLIDGTPLGGKTLNRTPPDRTPPDGRMLDRTPPDGKALDGKALDGRMLDKTPPDGRALNGTPPDSSPPDGRALDGRMLDKTPPDRRALNGTPPDRRADSVEPRAKPAGSTVGAHQENPQADPASDGSPQAESASDGGTGIPSQARGARHGNPQADLASAISLDSTDQTPPTRPAEESPALASTVSLDTRSTDQNEVVNPPLSPALASTVSLDTADNWVSSMRPPGISPALVSAISLDSADSWVMRCDRVDFSPAAVAHPHTHPGPGIRRLLFGKLTVTTAGATSTYRRGGAWFEGGPDVVYAEASSTEETAFVRVMLLPSEWAGKRTISYVDTAGATASTKGRQRATILGEELLDPLAKA